MPERHTGASTMADRRIIVQDGQGRRVSVLESEFDSPSANPFSGDMLVHTAVMAAPPEDGRDPTPGVHVQSGTHSGRSLKAEGFVPVMGVHGPVCNQRCTDACPGMGAEVPLDYEED